MPAWRENHSKGKGSVSRFFFEEHGVEYLFGLTSFWFDAMVQDVIDLSNEKLCMSHGRLDGHLEAWKALIRSVQEDNWREIVAYCEKQNLKEEWKIPWFVFVRESSHFEWKPVQCVNIFKNYIYWRQGHQIQLATECLAKALREFATILVLGYVI